MRPIRSVPNPCARGGQPISRPDLIKHWTELEEPDAQSYQGDTEPMGLDAPSLTTHRKTSGGSGTPVPDLSIEVDDVDEALRRMRDAGFPIEYGPVDEPWEVRRFYVRDPFGKLVNILAHI